MIKKFMLVVFAVVCLSMSMATTSFAASTNTVSAERPVVPGGELTGDYAPNLIIKKSTSISSDFSFYVNLNNATWLYDETGEITDGVTYTLVGERSMFVEVDFNTFGIRTNDLKIPLLTKIDNVSGSISVSVKPKTSGVSQSTHVFAHVNFPPMTVSLRELNTTKGTFDINITDGYAYSMPATDLFSIKIDNGFVFTGYDSITDDGKYNGIVSFKIDEEDSSIAYITLTKDATSSSGSFTVKGIQTASTDDTTKINSNVVVTPTYGETSKTEFTLSNFKSTEYIKSGSQVFFTIGSNEYSVDGEVFETDAAPYIHDSGLTMLPLRTLANAFSISDDDIFWDDETKTVTIINEGGKDISTTVGSKTLYIGVGWKEIDAPTLIKDSRTYLPMRPILNAFGVDDEDIEWDGENKTILVYYKN